MEIGPEILGYGSSGTLVFEGTLDGRPIAVKRILCQVCRALPAAHCLLFLAPDIWQRAACLLMCAPMQEYQPQMQTRCLTG